MKPNHALPFVFAAACLVAGLGLGADSPTTTASSTASTQPSPTADQVMSDLSGKIQKNPALDPARRPSPDRAATTQAKPAVIDPAVSGVAPRTAPVKTILRREGGFVLNRQARLVYEPGTHKPMAVFNADAQFDFGKAPQKSEAVEPPIYLLPNQVLESMETQAQDRADRLEFTISGQITTYRGANYLLLTSVKETIDRENLID